MTINQRIAKSPLLLAVATASLTLTTSGAIAQDSGSSFQLEEITVTARKREENLSDIPFSIAVQTEETLRNTGAVDMESMSRNVAGLTVQNLGPGQSQVAIRGISAGQIVRDQPGVKEQVGVYLDESVISASLFTPDLDFYDVNRVEVLRGPQGTLFGAGSLSGTIRYISNKPELDEFSGSVDASVLNVEDGGMGGDVKGMVNLPMGDIAALRLVAYYDMLPGYIDAIRPKHPRGHAGFTRDDDVNDGVRQGFRATLLLQPSEDLEIIPRLVYQDVEIDGMNRVDEFNILANPYATARRTPDLDERTQFAQLTEEFEDEMTLGDLTINWSLGDMMFTSVTSYTERDILMLRDATQLTGSITGQPGVLDPNGLGPKIYFLDAPLDDSTDIEMTTQEVRLASDGDDALEWVVGAFWSEIERQYGQSLLVNGFEERTGIPTAGVANPKNVLFYSDIPYKLDQVALFSELNYQFNDRFNLTGGLRWFSYDEERTLNFDGIFADRTIGLDGETDSDGYSPRVIAHYHATDEVQLTAQVSKGFRLGGINDPLNKPLCSAEDLATFGGFDAFEDEELTNYEIGAKMDLMEGRSQLNLAAYYSEIQDLQATLDAGTCSSRIVYNVPDAHVQGVEFEWFVTPAEGLDLGLTGTWTQEAELDSTVTSTDATGTVVVLGGLEEGNQLPTAAEFQMAASFTYSWDLCCTGIEGFVNGTWQYVGERWTQFADQDTDGVVTMIPLTSEPLSQATYTYDPEMDAYDLLNMRFGLRCETWEAALFVNNALDEDAELALDRERGFRARQGYLTNQPRTVGLTGRLLF